MAEYAVGDFKETRPILVESKEATIEATNLALKKYRILRSTYESALVNRYKREPLVEWRGKRYPISILSTQVFPEGGLIERVEHDSIGGVREYGLPEPIIRLNKAALLSFMEKNPLVRNPAAGFVDSAIAHPSSLDFAGKEIVVRYQKATYFNYVLTMLAMDVYSTRVGKTVRDLLEPGRQENGWKLAPLERGHGAGTFGIVCFVKACDGKFVVARRSSNVSNSKNTFAPSCTGFLRWIYRGDAPPSLFGQAKRHLEEELGITEAEIVRIECIGVTRELERAGHLDAHFYVEILPPFEEVDSSARRGIAAHRAEIENLIAVVPNRLTDYTSNPSAAPILVGSIHLLQTAHLLD